MSYLIISHISIWQAAALSPLDCNYPISSGFEGTVEPLIVLRPRPFNGWHDLPFWAAWERHFVCVHSKQRWGLPSTTSRNFWKYSPLTPLWLQNLCCLSAGSDYFLTLPPPSSPSVWTSYMDPPTLSWLVLKGWCRGKGVTGIMI